MAHDDPAPPVTSGATDDPVLLRRARAAQWVRWGLRLGWGLFGLATAVFVIGFAVGLQPWAVTVIVVSLVLGSVVLAPAIVLGHGIHAANRADREDSW